MGKRDRDEDGRDHRSHKKSHKKESRRSRSRSREKEAGRDSLEDDEPKVEQSALAKAARLKRLKAWKDSQAGTEAAKEESSTEANALEASKEPTKVEAASKPKPKGFGLGAVKLGGAKKMGGMGSKKVGGLMGLKKGLGMGFGSEEPKQKKKGPPSSIFSPPASPEASSPPGMSDVESEIDPLDAFMAGIGGDITETVVHTERGPSKEEPAKLATISFDEIQKMGSQLQAPAEDQDKEENDDDEFRQAFLNAIKKEHDERDRKEEEEKKKLDEAEAVAREKAQSKDKSGRFDDDYEEEYWVDFEEEENKYLDMLKKKKLSKELPAVDHEKIDYEEFERSFYIEANEIKKMTDEEVEAIRKKSDNTRIRGKDCPRPIKRWEQCGLPNSLLKALQKNGMKTPFAIQAQALPAIMSGRDVIGVAKTGSGKTLAFVIPMLRHIASQRPLDDGEGPIGMIMAPTRELSQQIFTETKRFAKPMNLNPVCCYGGAPISEQVSALKAGAEAVVCTPGRMVDLLCLNNGRVTNLTRTTYLVMDEADRMFDMGFEPQVLKIVANIRPDRQTVLFSATFPKVVEKHARNILKDPIQIICGGGVSVVSSTIEQHIEIIDEHAKINRLLALLGTWYDQGCILVFVDRQDEADELFRDLLKNGYPGLTLHGGKDQSDRDNTISDFKTKENTLMIATSVAARGLDVKDLVLVVNYNCPNHYEDYVHRVGRTGRAGRKGTSYTFITPEDDQYAGDMCKALKHAKLEVPEDLTALHNRYERRCKESEAQGIKVYRPSSGYKGKGYTFDEKEGEKDQAAKTVARMNAGIMVAYESNGEESDEETGPTTTENRTAIAPGMAGAVGSATPPVDAGLQLQVAMMAAAAVSKQNANIQAALQKATQSMTGFLAAQNGTEAASSDPVKDAAAKAAAVAASITTSVKPSAAMPPPALPAPSSNPNIAAALAKAAAVRAKINNESVARQQQQGILAVMGMGSAAGALALAQQNAAEISGTETEAPGHFQAELEINDYPQTARWKVTHKDSMAPIIEFYAVCITTRGSWFAVGRNAPPGERKLYLLIEGPDEKMVNTAKREVRRMLEETAAGIRDSPSLGRYSV